MYQDSGDSDALRTLAQATHPPDIPIYTQSAQEHSPKLKKVSKKAKKQKNKTKSENHSLKPKRCPKSKELYQKIYKIKHPGELPTSIHCPIQHVRWILLRGRSKNKMRVKRQQGNQKKGPQLGN